MQWSFISQSWPQIWQLTLDNVLLGLLPPLIGLAVSVPLGIACQRWRWLYPPVSALANAVYAIPSLAIFIVLIPYTGLGNLTVIIALALFSLCILLPNVVDGLRGVAEPVRQAATAMGFGDLRRMIQVELPIATPVILAGLRIAVVSSISLASVSQIIGVNNLGYFFLDGLQRNFATELYVAIFLVMALALVSDLSLVLIGRALTPWQRGQPRVRARRGVLARRPEAEAA
jgi:osmoprotectant transport system permease protein